MDLFFTTGQVADELKVSSQTIRNLCVSGQIKAERSPGGHFRIPPSELERVKALESLPVAARATVSGSASRQTKPNPNQLLAEPSAEVIESAEQAYVSDRELVADTNKLERMKIRKQAVELQDFFDAREQAELDKQIAEDRQWQEQQERRRQERRAELAAEERQRFTNRWIARALTTHKPTDAPEHYALVVRDNLISTLGILEPDTSEAVVEAFVNASIAHSLRPSRATEERLQAKRAAVARAIASLPIRMQWNDGWEARARKAASDAVESSSENASALHLVATAESAVRPLIAQFEHNERIRSIVESLHLTESNREDREEAQEAVTAALSKLPTSTSERELAQAKEKTLAPIRERIAARLQQQREEEERQQKLAAKERLVQSGLSEIYLYACQMLREFDYPSHETAGEIEQRVRPEVEKRLRKELSGEEDQNDVLRLVHEIMREIERCD
jgi:excisionase family DNA binding protein